LKLGAPRCRTLHSDGDDAFIFQPLVNYRTLELDKPLSACHTGQIVNRWASDAGLNPAQQTLSPHDLRRTAVTRALNLGFTYWQVQSMTSTKTFAWWCATIRSAAIWKTRPSASCNMTRNWRSKAA
jgi:integrase